jgi:hypothetical protein
MDPVSVILTALLTSGAQVAGDAVGDGYTALKGLIARKFGGRDNRLDEQHLDEVVGDEQKDAKPVEQALRESGAADDDEVLQLAREVLERARAAGVQMRDINARGGQVAVAGGDIHGGVRFGDQSR